MRLVEPFVRMFGRSVGAGEGRLARRPESLANVAGVTVLAVAMTWLITIWRQLPCMMDLEGGGRGNFEAGCYTDITVLYGGRGLADGETPYLDRGPGDEYPSFEYPVLTGWLVELLRILAVAFGAKMGPGLTNEELIIGTNIFAAVSFVVMFILLVALVVIHVVLTPSRPWDGLMLAIAPAVVLTGAINWDFLPVLLTSAAILAWARRSPLLAGALLGLGMAAKLYPLFLLGPLLVLCLRSGRMREFGKAVATFFSAWLLANLPALIAAPEEWKSFWAFNSDRAGDFGSIWYVLEDFGMAIPDLNAIWTYLFVVGCLAVAAIGFLAPHRPRLGQLAFLVVSFFLLVNKVYSPQYVLWLLPLLILARPKWRDWAIYAVAESLYLFAIWGHLDQALAGSGDGPDRVYALAVVLRIGVQLWLSALVIRDIFVPRLDPIRATRPEWAGWVDDPHGGVLDGDQDQSWATAIRRRINDALSGARPLITPRHERRWVLGTWLASRGMIVIALVLTVSTLVATGQGTGEALQSALQRWDVEHFVAIATEGYTAADGNTERMAFFPGLPMLLGAAATIGIPPAVTGVVVSGVSALLAAMALYRMGGVWAAGLWLLAPTAVFTFVPYTEAPFCALAFWAWERARSGKWWQVGLLAAGAATFRVSGLFLIAGLGILALTTAEPDKPTMGVRLWRGMRRAVWLLLPAAAVLAYAAFLFAQTGSWTAWFDAQQAGWDREWHWPWQAVASTIEAIQPGGYADSQGWGWIFRFEIVSTAVGLVATGYLFAKRRFGEATFVVLQVLSFMTSSWLFSVNRAVLLWFPVWLIAAELINHRPRSTSGLVVQRCLVGLWLVITIPVLYWWAGVYFRGQWAS